MDITVKDLNAMDEIAIRTKHSEYRFRVTDPQVGRGVLSGGLFGQEEHDAVLTCGRLPADLQDHMSAKLEIGGCALFYVAIKEAVSMLTTSRIMDLTLEATREPCVR